MKTVIIGSGMAGCGLFLEMQKSSSQSTVTLVTSEKSGYYSRPLLSHGFADDKVFERMLLKNWDSMQTDHFRILSETWVESIDRDNKRLVIKSPDGVMTPLSFDSLVIATGSAAFVPPPLVSTLRGVFLLNGWDDLVAMRTHRNELIVKGSKNKWAIVGGGFIGCEVASDFIKAEDEVVLLNATERIVQRSHSEYDSVRLQAHLEAAGVRVENGASFTGIQKSSEFGLKFSGKMACIDEEFTGILVAAGFRPRTSLAQNAGLAVSPGGGIAVNHFFRTNDACIYAIGDVASVEGKLYPFVAPIRAQVKTLAEILNAVENSHAGWVPGTYKTKLKVHGFV